MTQKFNLCIIIPAYNEANKLDILAYQQFLITHPDCFIVLANDCSTDTTLEIFNEISAALPDQCYVLNAEKNAGKAETVRRGMLWALDKNIATKYAFLDADLATSLDECWDISLTLKEAITFSFGSRILTVNSNIKRKAYRHYIGRLVATAISQVLKLEVYDTQCGCKVFEDSLCKVLFSTPFISRWLFDVELFFRTLKHYGRPNAIPRMLEYPLRNWIDKGESKVKFSYFFKLWIDLLRIRSKYRGV